MKPYDIAQIFAQMELDLIASMKRNLARHIAEEEKEGFEWEQWQKRKLLAFNRYRRENRKLLQEYGKVIDRETKKLIKNSFLSGARGVDGFIDRLLRKAQNWFTGGRLTRPITRADGTDDNFFRINERRINALIEAIQNDLRDGRAAMLRQADDVYRQTVFKSQVYLNSGATSLNQAVDMATRGFLDKGFNCIVFKGGRRMNIASYAEMVLRTSSQRAVFYGEGARRSEWGIRTVVVSSHNNSSDLCLPWQGKVYIDDVYSGGKPGDGQYPLLSTAMANGLFHPNCRHNMSTYISGISSLPEPVDDRKVKTNYEAEQEQRYMERQIRMYKRRETGAVDPVNEAAAAAKVEEWQNRLTEHLAANPQLRRDRSREQVREGEVAYDTARDRSQYERYRSILGDRAPISLEEFQRVKYNSSEQWSRLKGDYRKLNAYERIVKNEPKITEDLRSISEKTGAELVGLDFRLKSKDSYLRKVNSDSKNSLDPKIINDTIAGTNDVIRYTYQAAGDRLVESIESIIGELESKGYSRFKLKNTWNDKRNPYRGINSIFVSPGGQKFEVQFHTPESFELKNGRMHEIYEEYRLDSTSPERRAELTAEMFALSASLVKPKDIEKIK